MFLQIAWNNRILQNNSGGLNSRPLTGVHSPLLIAFLFNHCHIWQFIFLHDLSNKFQTLSYSKLIHLSLDILVILSEFSILFSNFLKCFVIKLSLLLNSFLNCCNKLWKLPLTSRHELSAVPIFLSFYTQYYFNHISLSSWFE